ncbi:hypothetical protein D3C81_1298490 [compost metagenome]
MNFLIYRRGMVGFPEVHEANEGVHFKVLEADISTYFSNEGFIYPLSGTGPNIADVVSGRLKMASHPRVSMTMMAFMITKQGAITQVDLFKNNNSPDEKRWTLDFHGLPSGQSTYVMCSEISTRDSLLGALAAWKDEEKFQQDTNGMAVGANYPIIWMSVEDIVARLNKDYPEPEQPEDNVPSGHRRRNIPRPRLPR